MQKPIPSRLLRAFGALVVRAIPLAVLLAVLLAIVLAPAGCQRRAPMQGALTAEQKRESAPEAGSAPKAALAAQAAPSANVQVIALKPRDFSVESTYIGQLNPYDRVQLRTETEGVVEKVSFDESQAVKRDQVLANIDTSQLTVRRDKARSDFRLAETNLKRSKELAAKKLIASAQLEQAQNQRDAAYYGLKLAQIDLDRSVIRTPLGGTVKTRAVSVGEFINKGQLIAEILDIHKVKAVINVPETEIRFLRPGKQAEVTLDALPGRTVNGVVKTVGLEADANNRSFPVEVVLDNPDRRLRPGMMSRVRIQLAQYENQILVPRYALQERETGRVAFIVKDGHAVERRVSVGAGKGDLVQVLDGLNAGDRLVVVGQHKLADKEPVKVQEVLPLPQPSTP